jgi:hypothetical protein
VAGFNGGNKGVEIDEFAAAGVEDDGARLEEGDATGVDEALGLGGEFGVEGDEVGDAECVVEGGRAF